MKTKDKPLTAPVTREEYEAFVETWLKLKPVLDQLTGPSTGEWVTRDYYNREKPATYHYVSWAEGYHDIKKEGVEFYYLDETPYEDYRSAYTKLIPLEHILDPAPVIQAHEDSKAKQARNESKQRENWEKESYERLKKKFERK